MAKKQKAVWPPKNKKKNNGATVCVLTKHGKPLMPTTPKRARQLMKKGRAQIAGHRPFTIRLLDLEKGETQPIEYKCDTGYDKMGISICTEKKELFSEERKLLADEPEKHEAKGSYRSNRRGRLRHRKPRFENRKGRICEDGFAPSIRNKRDQHVAVFMKYLEVLPITDAYFEMGEFDTHVLIEVAQGNPVPMGSDYQLGPKYGYDTLRSAVFARDHHTCQVCKRNAFDDGVILCIHHLGGRNHDHSNRIGNLLTVCTDCHTSANHQPGGALWNRKPRTGRIPEAAFMNQVRWSMKEKLEQCAPKVSVHITYGAATKGMRRVLQQEKSHSNDAFSMGRFHPKKRARTTYWRKRRRNNRVLEKFFDAHYIDTRDGSEKSGKQLSSDRTRRFEPRNGPHSLRPYRGSYAVRRNNKGVVMKRKDENGKVVLNKNGEWMPALQKGHRQIRKKRYPYRPGDTVWIGGEKCTVKGTKNLGDQLALTNGRNRAVSKVTGCVHTGGWERLL